MATLRVLKLLQSKRAPFLIAAVLITLLLLVELVLAVLAMTEHRKDQHVAFMMLSAGGTCDKPGERLIREGLVQNCGRQLAIRDKLPVTAAAEKFAARWSIPNLLNLTAENFGKIFLAMMLFALVIAIIGFQKYSDAYFQERRASTLLPSMSTRKNR